MESTGAIRLRDALAITNKRTRDDEKVPFHIVFYSVSSDRKKPAERIELYQATRCGVHKSLRHNDYLMGVEVKAAKHHPYTVDIHLISEINQMKVS